MQYGLGDAQVTWLGAHVLGRSIGAHMYRSNVVEGNETLFGFQFMDDSVVLDGPGDSLIQGTSCVVDRPPLAGLILRILVLQVGISEPHRYRSSTSRRRWQLTRMSSCEGMLGRRLRSQSF